MARFLVTGGAGFIGCNLVRALVERGESVRVIDDFSTGRRENLEGLLDSIMLFEATICDRSVLDEAIEGCDYCLHQAALPSVPRSVRAPWESNRANVEGTLNVFLAARDAQVRRVVFASSSSVYGNDAPTPLNETSPRAPLSPYGVTKATGEMYAEVFSNLYGIDIVCLRYFNVFGPYQDPASAYAAVIPVFISRMLAGQRPPVHGDGLQSRDFTYVENVVSANLKACAAAGRQAGAYNVACGGSTSVLDLASMLEAIVGVTVEPEFRAPRAGDVRRSCADISKAREAFGYAPMVSVREGLERTVAWHKARAAQAVGSEIRDDDG